MDKLKTSRLDKKEGKMQRSRAGVVVFREKQGGQGNGEKETISRGGARRSGKGVEIGFFSERHGSQRRTLSEVIQLF